MMKTDPSKESALILDSTGVGTISRKTVSEPATELALINRSFRDVSGP
jgi:hypothetical protein